MRMQLKREKMKNAKDKKSKRGSADASADAAAKKD